MVHNNIQNMCVYWVLKSELQDASRFKCDFKGGSVSVPRHLERFKTNVYFTLGKQIGAKKSVIIDIVTGFRVIYLINR